MTIFHEPRYKYLSEVVSLKDVPSAVLSILELDGIFDESKTCTKKKRVWRASREAAARAKASLNRKNLSEKERKELKVIHKLYDQFSRYLQAKLYREGCLKTSKYKNVALEEGRLRKLLEKYTKRVM